MPCRMTGRRVSSCQQAPAACAEVCYLAPSTLCAGTKLCPPGSRASWTQRICLRRRASIGHQSGQCTSMVRVAPCMQGSSLYLADFAGHFRHDVFRLQSVSHLLTAARVCRAPQLQPRRGVVLPQDQGGQAHPCSQQWPAGTTSSLCTECPFSILSHLAHCLILHDHCGRGAGSHVQPYVAHTSF